MPVTRLFQPFPLQPNATVLLEEKAHHHLYHVLRVTKDTPVVLFNGQGGEYHGTVTSIDKKHARVSLQNFIEREAESDRSIHLVQGIARGEKMDFIIQKAVELGVQKITPLITERCAIKSEIAKSEKRLQHWQAVAISACEQSGRNRIPIIESTQNFSKWIKATKIKNGFVLSPHVHERLPEKLNDPKAEIVLLIGPEGGLNAEEIALATGQGMVTLNLGPRILRTETAAVAAITVMQYRYGDMS